MKFHKRGYQRIQDYANSTYDRCRHRYRALREICSDNDSRRKTHIMRLRLLPES